MDSRAAEVLIIILCLVVVVISGHVIDLTGKATSRTVNLAVRSVEDAEILLVHPSIIEIGEPITIEAEVINTGSKTITVRPEILLRNATFADLVTYYDGYNVLLPGGYRRYSVSHYPNETGYYWIRAKVELTGGKDVIKWGLVYVSEIKPIYIYIPGPVSPGPRTVNVEKGPIIFDVSLEYPRNVSIVRGQSLIVPVRVTNIRKEIIYDLGLELPYKLPVVSVSPQTFPRLDPRESTVFLIHLTAPKEFPLGSHKIEFNLTSNQVVRGGTISVTVIEDDLRNEVLKTIENYIFILNLLKGEANTASLEGKDISKVTEYLGLAESSIGNAIDLFNKGSYLVAKEELEKAKENLGQATLELGRLKLIQQISLPAFLPLLFIIAVLAALPFMILLWRKRHKEHQSGLR